MHAFYWPKIQNLIKAKRNRKCKIPHKVWERRTLRFNSYKNHKLKIKPWWVAARKRKKMPFSVPSIISEENFFKICKQIVYWIHFQNIHIFTYQKTSYHTLLLLVSKIVESLHCILKFRIVFKCLKTFIYTSTVCMQDKPFSQRHSKPSRISFGLKYFVSIKTNIWIAVRIKKLSFTVKGLYDVDSKFASGAILVFPGNCEILFYILFLHIIRCLV